MLNKSNVTNEKICTKKKMVRRKLVERLREKKKEKTRTKQSEWLGAAS